jgi:multicomponent Na+:H+ antiporter subunit A
MAVPWGKALERMDGVLRQWPAAGVSLLMVTIALGAAIFAR